MDHLSDDEQPDSSIGSQLRRNEVVTETGRDVDASEYDIDSPVIVGPGLPPEIGGVMDRRSAVIVDMDGTL